MFDADHIGALARVLLRRAPALRALEREELLTAVDQAARMLGDKDNRLGRALRKRLLETSGLSPENIEWGLGTSLKHFERDQLAALPAPEGKPVELLVQVLAGNVFSASLRAILLPLMAGVPVLAKASSRSDGLPRLLKLALSEASPALGGALEVVSFGRGHDTAVHVLLGAAQHVSVYGSDETVAAIEQRLPPGCQLFARGHGLGAAFVGDGALASPEQARSLAGQLALDTAAYDQHGCLSPHAVFVQHSAGMDAQDFAKQLRDALQDVHRRLPLGQLDEAARASQMQWRGVAAARGQLFEGDYCAVSLEPQGAGLRPSPGFRNLAVHSLSGPGALPAALGAYLPKLKALSSRDGDRAALQAALGPQATPLLCAPGQMQDPPLQAALDGQSPYWGFTHR